VTPAIRILERAGIEFGVHEYVHRGDGRDYGLEAARELSLDPDRVFKTLVLSVPGQRPGEAVAIVPVSSQADLKAVGVALGAKRVEICDRGVAERLTGYVIGGISPIGQKKRLPTLLDASAADWPTIFVSGGRRGLDIEVAPGDLVAITDACLVPIAVATAG
jgi:Cys-tRNA(Pro)/Cys-tRNA(Cys) deacylase